MGRWNLISPAVEVVSDLEKREGLEDHHHRRAGSIFSDFYVEKKIIENDDVGIIRKNWLYTRNSSPALYIFYSFFPRRIIIIIMCPVNRIVCSNTRDRIFIY